MQCLVLRIKFILHNRASSPLGPMTQRYVGLVTAHQKKQANYFNWKNNSKCASSVPIMNRKMFESMLVYFLILLFLNNHMHLHFWIKILH